MRAIRNLGMLLGVVMTTSFACVHEVDAQSQVDPQTAKLAEAHKLMAAAHEQMANCLAAGKSVADCRQTMAKACAGIDGCVMQGGMGMGMIGMHGGRGMMMGNCPGVSSQDTSKPKAAK